MLVQIWAVLDSGAVSRLCSRAITSAAILLATWPLMNGLTGSDLFKEGLRRDITTTMKTDVRHIHKLIKIQHNIKSLNQTVPGQLSIPVPTNGSLGSFLLVASGDTSSSLLGQSLHRWPNTHYQTRLSPLVGLPQCSRCLLCDHLTASSLRKI